MGGGDVPTKHVAAPSAFEANDVIAPDRLLYRDGRCPGGGDFRFRFGETSEHLINARNQGGDLVSPDLIAPNKCGDDPRSEFPMGQCGRRVVRHQKLPVLPNHIRRSAVSKHFKYWDKLDFQPTPLIWPGMIHDCGTSKSYKGILPP